MYEIEESIVVLNGSFDEVLCRSDVLVTSMKCKWCAECSDTDGDLIGLGEAVRINFS